VLLDLAHLEAVDLRASGRPEADAGMGSFERWSRTVGGALQAAGVTGFRSDTAGWLDAAEDDDGWHDHLAQLRARYSDQWFTVAEVAAAIEAGDATTATGPCRRFTRTWPSSRRSSWTCRPGQRSASRQ
jgi:hypothetical protein